MTNLPLLTSQFLNIKKVNSFYCSDGILLLSMFKNSEDMICVTLEAAISYDSPVHIHDSPVFLSVSIFSQIANVNFS